MEREREEKRREEKRREEKKERIKINFVLSLYIFLTLHI